MSALPQLLIIWHSRTGGSATLAEAAHEAAQQAEGAAVRLVGAADVEPPMVTAAAGLLFICPENLATMSGEMKEMFDRCYYPCLGEIEGRAYATIICAGTDGSGAERQIDRIATGWRLRRVAESLIIVTGAQDAAAIAAAKVISERDRAQAAELGASLASGLALGVF